MLLVQDDDEIGAYLTPGIAPKLSASPGALSWSGHQAPGADNDYVFGELLGRSPADLEGVT
jgi:formyl-CoA transferase